MYMRGFLFRKLSISNHFSFGGFGDHHWERDEVAREALAVVRQEFGDDLDDGLCLWPSEQKQRAPYPGQDGADDEKRLPNVSLHADPIVKCRSYQRGY